jgi:hypothetical protein
LLRTALLFLAFSGVCLAQAPAPVDPAAKLIDEIETLASAEPPLLGIDTQTEAAKILLTARPPIARRFLDSALSRTRPLLDPHTVRLLIFPAIDLLYKLAPDEAAQLISAQLLSTQSRKPTHEDGLLLSSFAGLLQTSHPELSAACTAEFQRIRKLDPPTQEEIDKPKPKAPSTEGLDLDAHVELARKQKDPLVRIEMLLSAIDDSETPPRRRAALAAEALPDTEKLPIGSDDRLLSQSMLTRRLYEAGDRPGAALAAQMLEQTFIKLFDCETAACTSFKGEGSPGDMVRLFAEYLDDNKIDPGELGLTHRSLHVRMLLIRLNRMLGGKKPSMFGALPASLPSSG